MGQVCAKTAFTTHVIRALGDTAIVVGSMTLKGTGAKPSGHTWVESPETTFTGTLRFTRVWVKRDGSWMLAALQKRSDSHLNWKVASFPSSGSLGRRDAYTLMAAAAD